MSCANLWSLVSIAYFCGMCNVVLVTWLAWKSMQNRTCVFSATHWYSVFRKNVSCFLFIINLWASMQAYPDPRSPKCVLQKFCRVMNLCVGGIKEHGVAPFFCSERPVRTAWLVGERSVLKPMSSEYTKSLTKTKIPPGSIGLAEPGLGQIAIVCAAPTIPFTSMEPGKPGGNSWMVCTMHLHPLGLVFQTSNRSLQLHVC